jgi:tRNA (guanine-N7-)-methyltransferase
MRLRNVKDAGERIQSHPEWVIPKPESNRGFWNEVFKNDHPIYLKSDAEKANIY